MSDLCKVTAKLGLDEPDIDVQGYDLETARALIQGVSRIEWEEDAHTKPKLCTYVKMRCFDEQPCLAKLSMARRQRSLMAKLFCGIFPLELETGRYQGVKRELRYCRVCVSGAVEDEIHFLFCCRSLKETRKGLLLDIGADKEKEEERKGEGEQESEERVDGSEDEDEEEEEVKVSDEDC